MNVWFLLSIVNGVFMALNIQCGNAALAAFSSFACAMSLCQGISDFRSSWRSSECD